ncbi:MAG: hypothetical protein WKG06_22585 [Segetibacter sp.]
MKGETLLDLLKLPVNYIGFLESKGYVDAGKGEGWKVWLTLEGQHFIANGGFKDETKTSTSHTINIGGSVTNSQLNQSSQSHDFLPAIKESQNIGNNTIQQDQKKGLSIASFIKLITENPLISGILATLIAGLIIYLVKKYFFTH